MRTAVLAAAMSSAPMARPAIALLPPTKNIKANVDVTAEYFAVPANKAYDEIIEVTTIETLTRSESFSSNVAPTMILASGSTSCRTRLAASSTS